MSFAVTVAESVTGPVWSLSAVAVLMTAPAPVDGAVVAGEAGAGRQRVRDGAAGGRQVGDQRVGQGDAGEIDVARVRDHDAVVDGRADDRVEELVNGPAGSRLTPFVMSSRTSRIGGDGRAGLTGGSVSVLSAVAVLVMVPTSRPCCTRR